MKKLIAIGLCWLYCLLVVRAQDIDYREIHATAINAIGQSGMVNALVGPGQDTTAVLQSVTALRITGSLNSTDCMILRNKMPNLEHLDMSDVEMVAGGQPYYSNYTVTAGVFPQHLFYESVLNNRLVSVLLPNSVTTIGTSAFSSCRRLERVVLGENLESIGSSAFRSCQMLNHVVLPASLKSLDSYSFYDCTSLEQIVIPDLVTTLPSNCFSSCKQLQSLTLGSAVTSIGSNCFSTCSALQTIVFNGVLSSIGNGAFASCSSLSSIRLPMSLTSLGNDVFSNCNALSEIHVPHLIPLSLNATTFTAGVNGVLSKTTLYVPMISYYAYFWDSVWGGFHHIWPEKYEYDPVELTFHSRLSTQMSGFEPGQSNQLGYWLQKLVIRATGSFTVESGVNQGVNTVELVSDLRRHPSIINFGGMRVGHLNVKVPLQAGEWRLFAFPHTVLKSSVHGLPSNTDIRVYDGSSRASGVSGWKPFSSDRFEAGMGYAIRVPSAATLTYAIDGVAATIAEKDLTLPLSAYASANASMAGWNLMGNPYLSYYDIADLGISDPVVIFNASSQRYETYYPATDHYMLAPYEAFFVQRHASSQVSFLLSEREVEDIVPSLTSPRTSPSPAQQVMSAEGNPPEPEVMSIVTVSCDPASAGVASGSGIYAVGATATLSVAPNPGFQVDHWLLNGAYHAGALPQISYPVTAANASLVAVMGDRTSVDPGYDPDMPADPDEQPTQNPQVALRFRVSPAGTARFRVNGVLVGSSNEAMVEVSSTVHLECLPNDKFVFNGWYLSGSQISNEASYDYVMPNRSITLLASVEYSPSNPLDPDSDLRDDDIDNGQGVLLGDVNEDGTVDVTDAVQLVAYLKNPATEPEHLLPLRCDMNLDGIVDYGDAEGIIDAYLERNRFTQADTLVRQDTIADLLSVSSITLEPGGEVAALQLGLTSSSSYTAFALDVLLPEGIEADTAQLVSPVATHRLKYSLLQEDGQVLRIVCYNSDNRQMPSSLHLLLRLPLSAPPYTYPGELPLQIRHATLITAHAEASVPLTSEGVLTVAEHSHIPLFISEANKYSTLILPFEASLPAGLRAAEGLHGNDTCLYLSEVDVLEPFVPYIVYAPHGISAEFEGDYRTDVYVPSTTCGYLTGVVHDTSISEGYVLQNHGSGAAFYMVISQIVLPAGKAYLKRPAGAHSIAIRRYDPETEDEEGMADSLMPAAGHPDTEICIDLLGRRVTRPIDRGFYLSAGRKMIVE